MADGWHIATHTPIGGKMLRMTRTERLSLAVAEAAVAHHLGIEKHNTLAEFADIKPSFRKPDGGRAVLIRTWAYHEHPSQTFVVEVGHRADEEWEFDADLYQDDALLRKFWWDFSGPTVSVWENQVR